MKTSSFSKYSGNNGVSIAGKAPVGFEGKQYKELAPKYWFFKKFKDILRDSIKLPILYGFSIFLTKLFNNMV